MRFSPDNFLYNIKQIITGKTGPFRAIGSSQTADGGIKVDYTLPIDTLAPVLTDSTGGTASTTFAAIAAGAGYTQADMVAVKNAIASIVKILSTTAQTGKVQATVIPAGTNPNVGIISFVVPRDYDEASDTFAWEFFVQLANADANITLTGTPTVMSAAGVFTTGTAVTATLPFKTAAAPLSTSVQKLDMNFSGLGLTRDSILSVTFALVGTTTGNTTVYAVEPVIASTIVSYNDTDTTGIDGVLAEYGNPLR